jgi:beta-1,4-mannosyltransferase
MIMRKNLSLALDATVFYFSFLWPIAFYLVAYLSFFVADDPNLLVNQTDVILYGLKYLWFTGGLVVVANIIGILLFGSPLRTTSKLQAVYKKEGWNGDKRLIVTYVSRGDNFQALDRSIQETGRVLAKMDVDYRIDVITDMPVSEKVEKTLNAHFHVTPETFTTNSKTRYKARALHYMVEQRNAATHHSYDHQDVWILHLDEESIVTPSLVFGIHAFINDPANHQVIGQGEIQYNAHKYGSNLLITAADAIRTGDDLGRFRFQYKLLRRPLFGMHGSFVLVQRDLEHQIGFDLLPKQSITEDAYFAFKAADRGIRFNWVEGIVREQSPYGLRDILLQRRRWFNGLSYLAFDREISLKTRFFLLVNMILWVLAWTGPLLTLIVFLAGQSYFPLWATVVAALLQGGYTGIYMVGALRNLAAVEMHPLRKALIYSATFILVPFVNAIEGIAVLYALFKPVRAFHVVAKN